MIFSHGLTQISTDFFLATVDAEGTENWPTWCCLQDFLTK
jgi:hypothetical protein